MSQFEAPQSKPPAPAHVPAYSPTSQFSGKAVASLVFGVCSLIFSLLAALPAIILGVLALGDVRRRNNGGQGLGCCWR